SRAACEILVVDPTRLDHGPIEVVFRHLLERPADRTLFRRQAAIEVDAVSLLEMLADESGIGDARAIVLDVGQTSPGPLTESPAVGAEGQARHLQQSLRLGDERAGIGKPEGGTERVESDHVDLPALPRI